MATELEKRFDDPPRSFSSVPIWWWSGEKLDPERLRWQLERFVEGGIYNLVVMNLAPTSPLYGSDADDPPFFSEDWWRIFRGVCEDAKRLGVSIWFYDQIGFSGANLQGEIVKERPEFAGRWLERTIREMEGPGELACPAGGQAIAAAAVPIDDSGAPTGEPMPLPVQDGRTEWDGSGRHRVMLFYSVERGFDYFSSAACQALIDMVHGVYEARVGDHFGTTIVGSFQDELPSMPTWSQGFADEFEERRGYDLVPHLAALWEEYGDEAKRVRRDFHAIRAAVSEEAFFKPLFDWHEERGLTCGFDQQGPARAGYPNEAVDFYADYQRTHRWFGAPGSDHHGDAKIHSSLAHLYDRPRTWIEAFHSSGWGGTLEETFDWLLPWLRAGANLYDPHAVYYSTRGGWWEWAPPSTDWRQPYWEHYGHFSRTVSRLCSVLTLGHHVCDIGVLFPNATVQSGLRLDGPTTEAQAAHDAYLQLVGSMHWVWTEAGVLDRSCRDYDVLDDHSIQRGTVTEVGELCIGKESYSTLVLPACSVLEDGTASMLATFVERGGRLIAIGEIPRITAGANGDDDASVKALASLFGERRASRVDSAQELKKALEDVPERIQAPVPTLIRRVGDATVVFIPAAFPHATELRAGSERDIHHGWLDVEYRFDPSEYERAMTVKVRGVQGSPMLWEPYSGKIRQLKATEEVSGVEVRVPFADGPGVLLVWPGSDTDREKQAASDTDRERQAASDTAEYLPREHANIQNQDAFNEPWTVELQPTLDNRWGDFSLPATTSPMPVQQWEFLHRTEDARQDGLAEGWHRRDLEDSAWQPVHATFGPHGAWTGPGKPSSLPRPAGTVAELQEPSPEGGPDGVWQKAIYSLSRGIRKDPIHRVYFGPKGHVPEEFLDFGAVWGGEAVQFRTTVPAPGRMMLHLALGAAASKRAWINGEEVLVEGGGYLGVVPVVLEEGANLFEFRLEAEEDVTLRAHFAFLKEPGDYKRPEIMQAGGELSKDSVVSFGKSVTVPFQPVKAMIQVSVDAPCRVLINGEEVGRQGGFDPYFERGRVRVQPYDISAYMQQGDNEVRIDVSELGASPSVLVDALIEEQEESVSIDSDAAWSVARDGKPVPLKLRREQWEDPSWTRLWRRPHPLPASNWLEGSFGDRDPVVPLVPAAIHGRQRVEWVRFRVPPGAHRMRLEMHGSVSAYLDAEEPSCSVVEDRDGLRTLEVDLPGRDEPERVCALRVETVPGHEAGGIFEAPVTFEVGPGRMKLGNWDEQGLEGYSGGVRYAKTLMREEPTENGNRVLLDLGSVRGTAEVFLNGESAGVRIWSPYVFNLTDHLRQGNNRLEVDVFGTLGPYLDATSPTHFVFPGQRTSGLMGPVKLVEMEMGRTTQETESEVSKRD